MGTTAYAWDFSGAFFGIAVSNVPPLTSSFASNAQCGASGYGPGAVLETWYQTGDVPATLE